MGEKAYAIWDKHLRICVLAFLFFFTKLSFILLFPKFAFLFLYISFYMSPLRGFSDQPKQISFPGLFSLIIDYTFSSNTMLGIWPLLLLLKQQMKMVLNLSMSRQNPREQNDTLKVKASK